MVVAGGVGVFKGDVHSSKAWRHGRGRGLAFCQDINRQQNCMDLGKATTYFPTNHTFTLDDKIIRAEPKSHLSEHGNRALANPLPLTLKSATLMPL